MLLLRKTENKCYHEKKTNRMCLEWSPTKVASRSKNIEQGIKDLVKEGYNKIVKIFK